MRLRELCLAWQLPVENGRAGFSPGLSRSAPGWIGVEGLEVVLHDLPLLLVGLGTKPSLQAEPKIWICQKLFGFARNDLTCATHPWEVKGWERMGVTHRWDMDCPPGSAVVGQEEVTSG